MKFKLIIALIALLTMAELSGQRDTLGRYSPGFKFKDGLYLSFEDFKQNCPSIPLRRLRSEDNTAIQEVDPEVEWYWLKEDSLIRISKDSVWGYSNRGQVFLRHQEYFDRLIVIGSLSHIIHRLMYTDYGNAMYTGFGYTPVRREVQVEYFLDMRTGEKEEFTEGNLMRHFADDPAVYGSFDRSTKKKSKEGMFQFLHTYNQEHPIYFPISRCVSQ